MSTPITKDSAAAVEFGKADRPGALRHQVTTSITYAVLLVIAVVWAFPFLVAIATSFKTESNAATDPLSLIPSGATLAAYRQLTEVDFPTWLKNSVIVTGCVTGLRVFFDSLAGYALARLRFPGRRLAFALIIAVMAVPGVVLLIPKFLVIRQLGMYDTYFGMIIPLLVDASGVYIMKNFFESIPVAVEESARIDGASLFRIYWSIVLPMAQPAIITIFILSFQSSWNELSHFIIATQNPSLTTLTLGVAHLSSGQLSSGSQYPIKLAAASLMTIPVAVLFFIFQRRIMNVGEGAVKG